VGTITRAAACERPIDDMANRIGRKTSPGFADPNAPVVVPNAPRGGEAERREVAPQPAAAQHAPAPRNSHASGRPPAGARQTPMVEVEVSYERGSAPRTDVLRKIYEVWTNNHVYSLDSRLHCVEVRQSGTSKVVGDHPFLGTRLVGGQIQTEQSVEMSYPFPRPGSFAVFEARKGNRRQFSRTSAVTRVVLRLRIVSVTDPAAIPTWEEVSGEN
jgi:hypothetical protein